MTDRALFIGAAVIDAIAAFTAPMPSDGKITAEDTRLLPGGGALNACLTYCALGGPGHCAARLGENNAGEAVIEQIMRRFGGTLHDINSDPTWSVPVAVVLSDVIGGSRSIVMPSIDRARETRAAANALPSDFSLVQFDSHEATYALQNQDWLLSLDADILFDGDIATKHDRDLLKIADYAILSHEMVRGDYDGARRTARQLGLKGWALTQGAQPVFWETADTSGTIDISAVAHPDTLGAGDVFHGAFARGLSNGRSFPDSLDFAARIATESCRHPFALGWVEAADQTGKTRGS
jgi:sulfofructose kinase